ncbi:MAG: HK97 gp10 family phage protein [Bacteroidales bacterium]|nr:HK97 gp10 family phage protein [Bacteroidales bacterium]
MADVEIINHSDEVKQAMNDALVKALTKIGITVEGSAKDILSSRQMPHKDGTSHPNVETGRLLGSIVYDVDEGDLSVTIGSNLEYSPYIHEGTQHTPPNRFLKDAVQMNKDVINEIIERNLKNG